MENWDTIEETSDLAGVLDVSKNYDVYLIDCLTLWINNLMYDGSQKGTVYDEDCIEKECRKLIACFKKTNSTVILVTNEVGMSIIPADPETRLYRDLIGRANQILAEAADKVVLISCGIPLTLKG